MDSIISFSNFVRNNKVVISDDEIKCSPLSYGKYVGQLVVTYSEEGENKTIGLHKYQYVDNKTYRSTEFLESVPFPSIEVDILKLTKCSPPFKNDFLYYFWR